MPPGHSRWCCAACGLRLRCSPLRNHLTRGRRRPRGLLGCAGVAAPCCAAADGPRGFSAGLAGLERGARGSVVRWAQGTWGSNPRSLPCVAGGAQHGWCGHWARVASARVNCDYRTIPCARMGISRRGRPIAGPPGHIRQDSVQKCQISHVSVPSLPSHDPRAALPGPKVLRHCPLCTEPSRGHNLAVWRRNWTFYTPFGTRSS